jgi:cytochrome b
LPTRVLHWLLAGSFVGAFGAAVLLPKTHPAFPIHMLLGVTAALVVVLRILWGFVGTRYARFRSFPLGPRALVRHLKTFTTGRDDGHVGHDPFASWAALAMLASVLGVAVTGAMCVAVPSMRRVHHLFAYGAVALIAVHVVGVVLSTLRRRENLALGMLDGKKMVTAGQGLPSTRPIAALFFVALIAAAVFELVGTYDAANRAVRLPLIGQVRLRPWGKRHVARVALPPRDRD